MIYLTICIFQLGKIISTLNVTALTLIQCGTGNYYLFGILPASNSLIAQLGKSITFKVTQQRQDRHQPVSDCTTFRCRKSQKCALKIMKSMLQNILLSKGAIWQHIKKTLMHNYNSFFLHRHPKVLKIM